MKKIDWDRVPKRPAMVLLTAEEVSLESDMGVADFRDTHALYHEKSGRFVGLCEDGVMRLGSVPPELVNGVWYLLEDPEAQAANPDLPAMGLVLRIIDGGSSSRGR